MAKRTLMKTLPTVMPLFVAGFEKNFGIPAKKDPIARSPLTIRLPIPLKKPPTAERAPLISPPTAENILPRPARNPPEDVPSDSPFFESFPEASAFSPDLPSPLSSVPILSAWLGFVISCGFSVGVGIGVGLTANVTSTV